MKDSDLLKIQQWIDLLKKQNINLDIDRFYSDASHSALLKRLLDGKEPLPKPPIKTHSYPNYFATEQGMFQPFEVFYTGDYSSFLNDEVIFCVDQHSLKWKFSHKIGSDCYVAHHDDYGMWVFVRFNNNNEQNFLYPKWKAMSDYRFAIDALQFLLEK